MQSESGLSKGDNMTAEGAFCHNCRWLLWGVRKDKWHVDEFIGECHRHAPRTADGGNLPVWPLVLGNASCGDWEASGAPAAESASATIEARNRRTVTDCYDNPPIMCDMYGRQRVVCPNCLREWLIEEGQLKQAASAGEAMRTDDSPLISNEPSHEGTDERGGR